MHGVPLIGVMVLAAIATTAAPLALRSHAITPRPMMARAQQSTSDSPEPVIRALVRAIYARDVSAYNRLTLPDPRRARLTAGFQNRPASPGAPDPNRDRLARLDADPESLQMHAQRPPLFRGREAVPDDRGRFPSGTTALYMVAHGGGPTIVTLVRQDDGWKVDVRWWIAATDAASAPPKRGTPEYAIRRLAIAVLEIDRETAARFVTKGASMDVLFLGAQREPSGHLEATAMEMPLVELRPGEFFPLLPDARVVEGTTEADRKVFLGQFGPTEIPFVVRRSGGEWRVEPQPFFLYFNR